MHVLPPTLQTCLGEAKKPGRGGGGRSSCVTLAGWVTLAGGTYSHINTLARLPGMPFCGVHVTLCLVFGLKTTYSTKCKKRATVIESMKKILLKVF